MRCATGLGPLLWNVYYDDALRLEMPQEGTLLDEDDLVVLVAEKIEGLVMTANISKHRINEWMRRMKLAPEKTEAVLLVKIRQIKL